MNTFAGFWRDGAVVKPEEKHWSDCKCIFAIQKHDNSLDICLKRFSDWHTVYWLDTTTPTELTPQEAFEMCKILHPKLTSIQKEGERYFGLNIDERGAMITWGSLTEYPPRERWRVPTDADKGKRCRFKSKGRPWLDVDDSYQGTFLCIAKSGFVIETGDGVSVWACCEVLE
jgi:hypothetical protein